MSNPISTVDWNAGTLMPAPRKGRPNRQETFYPVTCGQCGDTRYLRRVDAAKTPQCRVCQCKAAGRLGYDATVAKYGADFALAKLETYRLAHPSRPEVAVAAYLDAAGVDYQREARFDGKTRRYLLDFMFKQGEKIAGAIEINGWHHHHRPAVQRRDQDLMREATFPLLVIDAAHLDLSAIGQFVAAVS